MESPLETILWGLGRFAEKHGLGKSQKLSRYLSFTNSKAKKLGKFSEASRYLSFTNSKAKELGKFSEASRYLSFTNSKAKELGKSQKLAGIFLSPTVFQQRFFGNSVNDNGYQLAQGRCFVTKLCFVVCFTPSANFM